MTEREQGELSVESAIVLEMQRAWASRLGFALAASGAALMDGENALFMAIDGETRSQFAEGAGGELARMPSLRSSSALAVNVFLPWKACPFPLGQLLVGTGSSTAVAFEVQFPTGVGRRHPHLDVVVDGSPFPIAVESKFLEPYDRPKPQALSRAYLRDAQLWDRTPRMMQLAGRIADDGMTFERLAAAQLIKHVLGLTRRHGPGGFRLIYLWYLVPGRSAETHRAEIERFAEVVDGEVDFMALTHQDLFERMKREPEPTRGYLAFLSDRYFPESE